MHRARTLHSGAGLAESGFGPQNGPDSVLDPGERDRFLELVGQLDQGRLATGDPAISLPLATTSTGLPQGMMLGAGAGREATLIELAYELEEAVPFARIQG